MKKILGTRLEKNSGIIVWVMIVSIAIVNIIFTMMVSSL